MQNDKTLNQEFAEVIGEMIYELHEMYLAFLRKESLEDPTEPPFDLDHLPQNEDIDNVPW